MYEPNTVLKLREPREPDQDGTEFPYNRVRVVGASPVSHSGKLGEWEGSSGDGVIIEPLSSFGTNLDEPFGRLQELYEVDTTPERVELPVKPGVKVVDRLQGESPEDVFARVAAEEKNEPQNRRVNKPKAKPSPLAKG